MIKILDRTKENVIGLEIEGKISHDEANKIKPMFMDTIVKHEKINLLLVLKDFQYSSIDGLLDDIQFIKDSMKNIERISIVGDSPIQELLTKATSLFIKGQKYFSTNEIEDAWNWVEPSK